MTKSKSRLWLVGLLTIINVLFLVYYCYLSCYYRPHYDDLHFMWKLRDLSIIDYVRDMYFSRSGRFAGYFENGLIFKVVNAVGAYWFFPILFILMGMVISCYIATDFLPEVPKSLLCSVVVLFYNLYVLTSLDFPVAFWLCAMGYYLVFPATLLLFSFINKKELKNWQAVMLIILVIIRGGGNEAVTPLVLVFLFINGIFYLSKYHFVISEAWKDSRVRRLVYCASCIVILFLIVVIAPGNYIRLEGGDEFAVPSTLAGWLKGLIDAAVIYHYFIFFYIPYYLVLCALTYILGFNCMKHSWLTVDINVKKTVLLMICFYCVYILCTILPSVFLYSGLGVQRNYTHTVYMSMLNLCLLSFILGYSKGKRTGAALILCYAGLLLLCCVGLYNIRHDIPAARLYADAVDSRIEFCEEQNQSGAAGIVEVDSLPVPYTVDVKWNVLHIIGKDTVMPPLYYISEASSDGKGNEYSHHLRKLYNWNFDIVVRQ